MPIRVLINGAQGKMGQAAVAALNANAKFIVAATTGRNHSLADEIKKNHIQVALDLTEASAAKKNLITILEAGARPVIGTSGLTQKEVDEVRAQFQNHSMGGIIAPNFSLGAILMMKYATEIARYFSEVEIIEMHHEKKLDSPSGTAIRTAELLSTTRQPSKLQIDQKNTPNARGTFHHDIPIHSLRLPGVLAEQQIIFGSLGETLTLRHSTIERSCFMPGILLACEKVLELDKIIYGLENIL